MAHPNKARMGPAVQYLRNRTRSPFTVAPFLARGGRRTPHAHAPDHSVDRDDMPDGGASHIASTIRLLKQKTQGSLLVEALVPDFQGNLDCVKVGGGHRPTLRAAPRAILRHSALVPIPPPRLSGMLRSWLAVTDGSWWGHALPGKLPPSPRQPRTSWYRRCGITRGPNHSGAKSLGGQITRGPNHLPHTASPVDLVGVGDSTQLEGQIPRTVHPAHGPPISAKEYCMAPAQPG